MSSVGRSRWYRIGLMLFVMYLSAFIDRSNIGMAAPAIAKHLGLPSAAVGVLLSAFFWGYVITQVPGGILAAKASAKKVVLVVLIVWGLAAIATGLAASMAEFIAARLVMGLAEGMVWPAFAVILVRWFPDHERAKATNLTLLSLPLSSVIMSPLAGWMIHRWNYHVMFWLQGLPPIALAILFYFIGSDSPEEDQMVSAQEREYLVTHRSTVSKETGTIGEVLGNPRAWLLGIGYFLWINGFYSFGLWLPSVVSQSTHFNIEVVGIVSALPFVLACVGMYVNSVWSDRRGINRAWFVAVPLLISGVALIVDKFFLNAGFGINMFFLVISGIGVFAAFGPWWAWTMNFFPRNQTGTGLGFINMCGNFGGITGPIFIGLAAVNGKAITGFWILGVAQVIAFGLFASLSLSKKFRVERSVASLEQQA